MKKNIVFSVALLFCTLTSAQTQIDTLGKYPFYYYYNYPETNSSQDSFTGLVFEYLSWHLTIGAQEYFWNHQSDFFDKVCVYFHSEDTLWIVGLSFWASVDDAEFHTYNLSLYDDNLSPMISTTWTPSGSDSGFLRIIVPEWSTTYNRKYAVRYFNDSIKIAVVGDFYIGISPSINNGSPIELGVLMEYYPSYSSYNYGPYFFPPREILFYGIEKEWNPFTLTRAYPLVFPVIELPCHSLEEVRVTEEGGCVVAEWDSVELQDQWVVELTTSAGLTVIDTVDSCHYEFCGLMEDEYYRVKVRSRCIRTRCIGVLTHHWSPWSAPVGTLGIEATQPSDEGLRLAPNPATGRVTVTLPQGARCLTVHSVDGREVYRNDTPAETLDIDVSRWARGVYTVGVESDRGTMVKKLVVE